MKRLSPKTAIVARRLILQSVPDRFDPRRGLLRR